MYITFHIATTFGIYVGEVTRQIQRLENKLNTFLLKHQLYERIAGDGEEGKKYSKKNKNELLEEIKFEVNSINECIKGINEICKVLKLKKKINKFKFSELKLVINRRFSTIYEDKKSQQLGDDNFRMKLHKIFSSVGGSITKLLLSIEDLEKFEGIKKLERRYGDEIKEAIAIQTMSYFNTSIFVVGRTLERLLDELIKKGIKNKKIEKINLKKVSYMEKIKRLKDAKIISNKIFYDLNSIRVDRNETGHPLKSKKLKEENRVVIEKSILIIKDLQKKLKK